MATTKKMKAKTANHESNCLVRHQMIADRLARKARRQASSKTVSDIKRRERISVSSKPKASRLSIAKTGSEINAVRTLDRSPHPSKVIISVLRRFHSRQTLLIDGKRVSGPVVKKTDLASMGVVSYFIVSREKLLSMLVEKGAGSLRGL